MKTFDTGTYVRCSKLRIAIDAMCGSADVIGEYSNGIDPGISPPVGYWVTGRLLFPVTIGQPIYIDRDCRNGVKTEGSFGSSSVVSIGHTPDGLVCVTRNSVYLLETISL